MSNLITTVEHAFAVAAQDVVKEAKLIQSKILPVLQKVETEASTVESITSLISPQAANIERMGFAALGAIISAIESAGAAAAAGGVSVSLDAAFVADVKAIIPAVKAAASVPAAPVSGS